VVIKRNAVIIEGYHCYQLHAKFYPILSQGKRNYWVPSVWISTQHISYWWYTLHSSDLGKKWKYNGTVHRLFIDFEKAYDSVRRGVLYNILTEFGIPAKLVRLIKMCLKETYCKVCIGKHVWCISYLEWSETRRCFIAVAFQLCFRICHQKGPRMSERIGIECNTSSWSVLTTLIHWVKT
jgi:hypothetical protein